MNKVSEDFYVLKYTKGRSKYLVQESAVDSKKLPIFQKIFNIDPNHVNII